ncbi:hypothetical protein GCM10027167_44380 [Nocardia heshunensis]
MTPEKPRPARRSAPRRIGAEVKYLQHADGSWSLVGRDGGPVAMGTYRAQLTNWNRTWNPLRPWA